MEGARNWGIAGNSLFYQREQGIDVEMGARCQTVSGAMWNVKIVKCVKCEAKSLLLLFMLVWKNVKKSSQKTKRLINLYLCTSALEGGLGDTREQLSLWGDRGEVVGKNWGEFLATPHLRRKQTIACVPPQ